jgi:uncharacterized protein YyaL (SSP411 family)
MANELKSEEEKKVHQSSDSPSDRESHQNRLIFEKSPYLLQHAENPVDWYPWSEEAFLKAEKEDKPVFLSIGYSACHWCQVMERESFEDEEVAKLMNKYFVAVKVDREERPDIDNIYMTVCQFMTGSGGWPLTIIMTPDKEPFFAGTYFPKQAKYGRPGLMEILEQIASLWRKDRPRVLQAGNQVTQTIQNFSSSQADGDLTEENLKQAYQEFHDSFDETRGGFGRAPKFPTPHNLSFLLRWWKRSGEEKALQIVEKTLDAMWRGGMYDHLGFGFHRYSTDSKWLAPHFEKMLYDQAMLAIAYVEAYQATGKAQYGEVADQIFKYVLRDMTSPEGAFYSSENADSEGEEGKFYVWTQDEIKAILGDEKGDLFCRFYGVTKKGNLEEGRSVLHLNKSLEEFASDEGIARDELSKIMELSRERLFAAREKRVHPSRDDKILTDWNGLMIAALAKGAQALDKPEYADAARRAANFLLQELRRKDGRLLHRYREGEAAIPGYLDDYAFLAWGLIDLYEATFEASYLQEALALTDEMLKLFWDDKNGGFYFTGSDNEELIARMKDAYDGAIPSGNSVASLNLLRFGRITMRQELEKKAEQAMESFGKTISSSPTSFSQLLIALDFALGPTQEIVIAGNFPEKDTKLMLRAVHSPFFPRKVLILHPEGEAGKAIEKIVPFVKHQNRINGKATAYVCENFTCKLPTTDVEKMISYILQ